ncbi:DUF1839 family protein [Candidatus Binatus sp.]|uniref:DUF1839 family protein n=1 Tax=Candidatus Binatus sp. TaxID=2811406 RepID=UPI003CC617F4
MSAAVDTAAPADCDWPITNCYVDVWMLVLAYWGLDPIAGLGVTVAQDYEGDQFTFFKYQHDELELLYGIVVGELSIYRSLEAQIEEQTNLGRLVLVEADGYYLPDTRATSYRAQHTKTTIAVDTIDPAHGRLSYFHNIGHYYLDGEDYAGVFRKLSHQKPADTALPPYVEFVKRRFPPLTGVALADMAMPLLHRHLQCRPTDNPIRRYREDFPRHMDWLLARPETFHDYAFNTFRQLGANHELLARHLDWMQTVCGIDLADISRTARTVSSIAKAMQFKVARIAARGRFDPCTAMFETLEQTYETMMSNLERALP